MKDSPFDVFGDFIDDGDEYISKVNSNNSVNDKTKNNDNDWGIFGINSAAAILKTGLDIVAQKNGVYAPQITGANNTPIITSAASPRQQNQQILPLLLVGAVLYLLVKG
jgi:hypothetical protein